MAVREAFVFFAHGHRCVCPRWSAFACTTCTTCTPCAGWPGSAGRRVVSRSLLIYCPRVRPPFVAVRCFGTEGRAAARGLPAQEVMPAAQVYDMVVFQGAEIAELTVLQPPPSHLYGGAVPGPEPVQAPPPAVPASPWGAPVAAPQAQPDLNNPWGAAPVQPAAPKQASSNPLPTPAPAPTVSVGTAAAATAATAATVAKSKPLSYAHAAGGTNPVRKPQAPAARGGRGGRGGAAGRGPAGGRGGRGGAPGAGGRGGYSATMQHHMSVPLAIPTTEFDFQASLTRFDKERIAQDLSGKKGFQVKSSEEVYQKDDFFDSLSCEALEKQQGGRSKFDRQRHPNSATFGYDGGRGNASGGRGAGGGRSQRGRGSGSHYQRKPVST